MTTPVQLYVYDLSNGMARRMSLQLMGRQIDGIWHTSVVIWGKEIFYGQGISITPPGRSHLGRPLQVIDMGETAIDQETFEEYLSEMYQVYTADKYHLLEFNCNSFTQDVIGFLTGGSIPSWIRDLPSDFLSTPFGAALRPTIDNMFRRTGAAPPPAVPQATPNPALEASLLQSVASLAQGPANGLANGQANGLAQGSYHANPAASTVAAPIQICTNTASFNSLLTSHRALVAFFTSSTCGPCKMVEPTFESLAHEKTRGRAGEELPAFVKIDLDVGMSGQVAQPYGVRATPTFIFFLNGKKIHELKGANPAELRTQVDLLLYQAFPPHPHTKLSLPAVQAVSLTPILFTQIPPLPTVFSKFSASVKAASIPESNRSEIEATLARVLPYLQGLAAARSESGKAIPALQPAFLASWAAATSQLAAALAPAELFPLVDIWRLALLDPAIVSWLASGSSSANNPLHVLLARARDLLADAAAAATARNTVLTSLRLLANALASDILARSLVASPTVRAADVLVPGLLHADGAVRTAAASVAFNLAAAVQRPRVERVRAGRSDSIREAMDSEWEVEVLSAVVEAIQREETSEDVVHRLTASLAFLLRLSPTYDEEMAPLLEVLQAKGTLKSKATAPFLQKPEVRRLVGEVADKLCP